MKKFLFILSLLLFMPSCEKMGEVEDMMTPLEGVYKATRDPMNTSIKGNKLYRLNPNVDFDASIHRYGDRWFLDRYFINDKDEPVILQSELTWSHTLNQYLIDGEHIEAAETDKAALTNPPFMFYPEENRFVLLQTSYVKIDRL